MNRRFLFAIVQVVGTIVILWWLLDRTGWDAVAGALAAADRRWLLAAAVVMAVSVVVGALQWSLLLGFQGLRPGWWPVLHAYANGMFLNFVLPTGMGGDMVRALHVHRLARGASRSFAATLLDRLAGLLALGVLALLAAVVLLIGEHHPNMERLALAVGLSFGLLLVGTALLFSRRASRWIEILHASGRLGRAAEALASLRRAILNYRHAGRLAGEVAGVALVVQMLRVGVHILVGTALGLSVAPQWFLLFVPLVALISIVPITVGGWGPREGLQRFLFTLPGVMPLHEPERAAELAMALALTTSLTGLVVPALGSAALSVFLSRRGRKIAEQAETS